MKNKNPEETIQLLNNLLELDSDFINKMFSQEFDCNEEIGDHPTVQVRWKKSFERSGDVCTVLGLINGIFGVNKNNYGFITAVYNEDKIVKFELTREQLNE